MTCFNDADTYKQFIAGVVDIGDMPSVANIFAIFLYIKMVPV